MLHARRISYVTDPATGRSYPIPAGGATDDGGDTTPPDDGGGGSGGGGAPSDDSPDFGDDDKLTMSREAWSDLVERRLRSERKKYADYDELREKAARLDELEDQQKSEAERLQEALAERDRQLTELQRANQDNRLARAVMREAAANGVTDPRAQEDLARLIDRDAVEFDGDNPTNVDALVSAALEDRPWLTNARKPSGSADGGARGAPSRTGSDMESLLRAAVSGG